MGNPNSTYIDFLEKIVVNGSEVDTRNSKTKRLRNLMVTFEKTPLITLRTTAWKNALREMEWFLSGSAYINKLHPKVQHWWKPWANNEGVVPNNYGHQFRSFHGMQIDEEDCSIDQIEYVIDTLKSHPFSRRNVITTWNTADMVHPSTPITNCHGTAIQLFVEPDNSVHMTMYQRSCDMVLGVPHNWIQYWALLQYFARKADKLVGSFTWIGGDCHVYEDHYSLVDKLSKEYTRCVSGTELKDYDDVIKLNSPDLIYRPTSEDFKAKDFTLDRPYESVVKQSAKMVV